ncbi:MAG TPA: hypothetical protein VFE97_10100 [Methylomirabilota bacterium]|nr:hypothetical protein [Methylomirabilota bacterium]
MAARHLAVEAWAVEVRHLEVADDQVVGAVAELVERLDAVVGGVDPVIVLGEDLGQGRRDLGLVVDDQD